MRLSRDERRLRLLLAAIEVFGEKGYRKTEVSEIVHRAGVTKPMLYRHFPGGKAEIYMEVLDDHLQSMMRKLGEAMAKAEAPLDALRRGIDAYLRFAEENPEAFHLLAETSAELDPGIVDRLKEVRTTIADGLAETIGAVLRSLIAALIWATAIVMNLDALDVNPLVAGPHGCVAVDALVIARRR